LVLKPEPTDHKRGKSLKKDNQPEAAPSTREFKLVPLPGVQISAGPANATTDADGKFLLRNLPAGELKVTVSPVKPVPAGMNIPSGMVRLPAEPVQVQGATIVITNSELLPYLSREFHNGPEIDATETVTKADAPAVRTGPVTPTVTAPALATTPEQPASFTTPFTVQKEPVGTGTQVSAATPATTSAPVQTAMKSDASSALAVPQLVPRQDLAGAAAPASDGVLTREVCNQLPSLGEIAQCLRQLKLNSSENPK
jgi:hypothetical protein